MFFVKEFLDLSDHKIWSIVASNKTVDSAVGSIMDRKKWQKSDRNQLWAKSFGTFSDLLDIDIGQAIVHEQHVRAVCFGDHVYIFD